MSYSLEQLPDGTYRLEIRGESVCFSSAEFESIRSSIFVHEAKLGREKEAKREAEIAAMLKAVGVGVSLPQESIFREAVADKDTRKIINIVKNGMICPNGAILWSAYFSKVDWEVDGYLFSPCLEKRCGKNALEIFRKLYKKDEMTRSVFDYLSPGEIERINTLSSSETYLVNIGLSDSRDYTTFNTACARVYGVDNQEKAPRIDMRFAKENFNVMVDTLYDAAVFISESPCNRSSQCPALERGDRKSHIKESAECIMYLSSFFTDDEWEDICRSNIWLLVKDIVAVRRPSRPVAA